MICVSIVERSVECCLEALEGHDLAEIRMDGMDLNTNDIKNIFSRPVKLIATCRPGRIPDEYRMQFLKDAIHSGAAYVDIEMESESAWKRGIVDAARSRGCHVIISYHDYEKTPGLDRLNAIISRCLAEGADIVKIACMVRSEKDNAKLLGLLGKRQYKKKLLVVGMGPKGKITRVTAPFLGSPFSYACLSRGKETADGQIVKDRLEGIMRGISDA